MELVLIILIAVLYAGGVFLLLRRSMVKLLIGITLLGNGANLLIFLLGGITKGKCVHGCDARRVEICYGVINVQRFYILERIDCIGLASR